MIASTPLQFRYPKSLKVQVRRENPCTTHDGASSREGDGGDDSLYLDSEFAGFLVELLPAARHAAPRQLVATRQVGRRPPSGVGRPRSRPLGPQFVDFRHRRGWPAHMISARATLGMCTMFRGRAFQTVLVGAVALLLASVPGVQPAHAAAGDPFSEGTRLAGTGALLEGVVPARLLDTRGGPTADGAGTTGAVAGGGVLVLTVAGRGGVPDRGAGAVALNVTATGATSDSYITAWPTGEARPVASNLNITRGETAPNVVIVKLGRDGQISFFNHAGSVHLIVDVSGWFPESTGLYATAPARLADTRGLDTVDGQGPVGPITPTGTAVVVAGRAGLPSGGVGSVVLNVTATEPTANSFLTVWPDGAPQPLASNLNFRVGDTRPNLVVAKVGEDGAVRLAVGAGTAHVAIDLLAWVPSTANFVSVNPARLADTRGEATVDGLGPVGAVKAGSTIAVAVGGRAGLAPGGVAVLNVTATDASGSGFVTVWPSGVDRPVASNLNVTPGDTRPNLVVTPLGPDGVINIYVSAGTLNLVVDAEGIFPSAVAGSGNDMIVGRDTRIEGPGDVVAATLDGVGDGKIALSASSDVPPVGGYIVASYDGTGPAAIVGLVGAVAEDPTGTTVVTVSGAQLADAVRLVAISSTHEIPLPDVPGQYDGLAVASQPNTADRIHNTSLTVDTSTTTGAVSVDFWSPKKWARCSAGIDGSVNDLGIKGELRNLTHEFTLIAAAGTVGYYISGEFVVQTRVKVHEAVTCGVSVEHPFNFSIEGIPFEFKAKMGFDVTIQAGSSWTDTAVYRFRTGTLFHAGQWTTDRTMYRVRSLLSEPALEGALTLTPYIELDLYVGESKIVAAGIRVTASAPISLEYTRSATQTCWTVSAKVELGLGVAFEAFAGKRWAVNASLQLATIPVWAPDKPLFSTCRSVPPPSGAIPPPVVPPSASPGANPPPVSSSSGAVSIAGRFGACPFGPSCLIAAFSTSGFNPAPNVYTCIFSNGSRYNIAFGGGSVTTACYTNDRPDSIAIEVAGVRSGTVTTNATTAPPPTPGPGPAPALTFVLSQNPFLCDGTSHGAGTLFGAQAGELIAFASPTVGGLRSGTSNGAGQLSLIWQCTPSESGQSWTVTATGQTSGRTGAFTITGAAPGTPPPQPTPPGATWDEVAWGPPGSTDPLFSGGPGVNANGAAGPAARNPVGSHITVDCRAFNQAVAPSNSGGWWYHIAAGAYAGYWAPASVYENGSGAYPATGGLWDPAVRVC